MKKIPLISRLVVIAAFCVVPFSAHAAIILNSGSPDFSGDGGVEIGSSFLFAEQFTLGSSETIDSVQLGLSLYTFDPSWNGSLQYYLYDNSGGLPSTIVQQGTNPAFDLISLGEPYPDTGSYDYDYEFNLATPVTLSAGTYWIGVQTSTSSDLEWVEVNETAVNSAEEIGGAFYNVEETLSLELSNTPLVAAPEPATGGLVLLAGIVLGAMRLRRGKNGSRRQPS